MSTDDGKKRADIARLIADLRYAKIELLSAQCATDRLRLQYSLQDIVSFGEPETLKRVIASVEAVAHFYSQVSAQLKLGEEPTE